MSDMTPETVRHLADLARIALSEEEIVKLAGELSAIVDSVEAVQKVASDDVLPTSHPIPLGNVFREDVVGDTLTTEEALAGAPDHDGSRFRVTAILGDVQCVRLFTGQHVPWPQRCRLVKCPVWRPLRPTWIG